MIIILYKAHLNIPLWYTFIPILSTFIPLLFVSIQLTSFHLIGRLLVFVFLFIQYFLPIYLFLYKRLWDPQREVEWWNSGPLAYLLPQIIAGQVLSVNFSSSLNIYFNTGVDRSDLFGFYCWELVGRILWPI